MELTPEREKEKFLLVSIIPHQVSDKEALIDLKELKSLVEAYGGEVVDLVVQRREVHDKGMYIGRGKIAEIAILINEKNINCVVLNATVIPGQIYEIQSMLAKAKRDIQVWD